MIVVEELRGKQPNGQRRNNWHGGDRDANTSESGPSEHFPRRRHNERDRVATKRSPPTQAANLSHTQVFAHRSVAIVDI